MGDDGGYALMKANQQIELLSAAVSSLQIALLKAEAQVDQATRFIRNIMWISGKWCHDVDGVDIKLWAEKCELIELVTVTEPCSDICACKAIKGPDAFPLECYQYADWVQTKEHKETI